VPLVAYGLAGAVIADEVEQALSEGGANGGGSSARR
jgi:hypothetical protein